MRGVKSRPAKIQNERSVVNYECNYLSDLVLLKSINSTNINCAILLSGQQKNPNNAAQ
jgi:hypothetical protein